MLPAYDPDEDVAAPPPIEPLDETEARLQPGSVKHAIFMVLKESSGVQVCSIPSSRVRVHGSIACVAAGKHAPFCPAAALGQMLPVAALPMVSFWCVGSFHNRASGSHSGGWAEGLGGSEVCQGNTHTLSLEPSSCVSPRKLSSGCSCQTYDVCQSMYTAYLLTV
jgi:hypothetical protein